MSVKRVDPDEAARLVGSGWTYLDVRSEQEFSSGHPAGAYNIPIAHLSGGAMVANPDFAAVVEATFAPDSRLVIGCKSGGRSLRAAGQLVSMGYTELVDMRGGFGGERTPAGQVAVEGWEARDLPVATTAEPGRSYLELLAVAKTGKE